MFLKEPRGVSKSILKQNNLIVLAAYRLVQTSRKHEKRKLSRTEESDWYGRRGENLKITMKELKDQDNVDKSQLQPGALDDDDDDGSGCGGDDDDDDDFKIGLHIFVCVFWIPLSSWF
ncbi:hypothetical protein ElyMa_001019500 [Elysia marginata]|uniref:Uncharacterized protein n=1 Tax=Elysia marginata TaxID=1093978 RepID=A0AAV4HKN8_9GAST|nr:hypothetical protein ElyMa_001019500 [Elysia marginata]